MATRMESTIRISVVIPTYNRGHLIQRAIDSVLNQTFAPAEIIVVDDGSEDDTRGRVAAYGERVRYLHQENGGSAAARHRGMLAATHDWVALLDSDDLWLPTHLERVAEAIRGTDGAARFYFADTVRSSEGGGKRHWDLVGFQTSGAYELAPDAANWVMMGRQPMMLQATVFSKAAYLASGGFWQPLRYRDDTHLYMNLGIGGAACAVNNIGCQMTDDDQGNRLSTTHNRAKKGCQMQVLMHGDMLERKPEMQPQHRRELQRRLSNAHRCLARHAWRERNLKEVVWHLVQSFLARPRTVGNLVKKTMVNLGGSSRQGVTEPASEGMRQP